MKVWTLIFFTFLSLITGSAASAKAYPHARVSAHRAIAQSVSVPNSPQWATLSPEQQSIASWIQENQQGSMSANKIAQIVKWIYTYAKKSDIDPVMFSALIMHESRFNPNAISSEGAKGLAQVLPRWHKDKLAGRSPFDSKTSIEVGALIFKEYLDKANGNTYRALQIYEGGLNNKRAKYPRSVLAQRSKLQHYIVFDLFSTPPYEPQREYFVATN